MPPRLQRFFLRLMQFDIVLQWVPGKELLLAGALSRIWASRDNCPTSEIEDVAIHATSVLSSLVSDAMVSKIEEATAQTTTYSKYLTLLKITAALLERWLHLRQNPLALMQ